MSLRMITKALETNCGRVSTKAVLLVLASHANDNGGSCYPSLRTIARECDLSEQGVINQIERLEELGHLRVKRSKGRELNDYTLTLNAVEGSQTPTLNAVEGCNEAQHSTPLAQHSTPLVSTLNAVGPTLNAVESIRQEPSLIRQEPSGALVPPVDGKGAGPGRKKAEDFHDLIPDVLNTPEFVSVWDEWLADRKDRRKAVTRAGAKQQLADLAGFGLPDALSSIKQSIASGWMGLFAPKKSSQASAASGLSILDLKSVIAAKEKQAADLKRQHCSTTAMGDSWSYEPAWEHHRKLRKEINEINDIIAGSPRFVPPEAATPPASTVTPTKPRSEMPPSPAPSSAEDAAARGRADAELKRMREVTDAAKPTATTRPRRRRDGPT